MNYKFEKAEKSTVKISITLDAAEWSAAQTDAYNKTKGKYALPGFRKGKVPMRVLENTYGKGLFFEDAINECFPKYYFEILGKEPSIEAVARPSLEVENIDENGITLVAVVAVKPEVKLGEYKGIKFEKVEYNVKDEEVEEALKRLQERNSRLVNVEGRAAENGDTVVIDYSGSVDGVKFDGGTAEKQNLELGSNSFIAGFEEQVVGMNIGEEKDIHVTFPEEYHAEELKGKPAVFRIKLHEIKKKELPEITDEFVKDADGAESVEAFRAETKKRMQDANEKRAQREIEDKIVKTVTEKAETEIPDALVENQIDNMVQEMEYRLMYQGLRLEDYLKYAKMSMEDYRKGYAEQAKELVKQQLVIEKIIAEEKIEATDEEVENKIKENAEAQNKSVEDYKKDNAGRTDYIKNEIVIGKLFDFLKSANTIE
ncbi:MAG: trigger factor [Bacillota bacterium]|nr:MAG: trigger factor [Bacillota bacterium]